MIVTDSKELKKYADDKRLWQGIPGIEVTKKGRIFVTFYSGGTAEQAGNYVLLFQSDGKGAFNGPVAAVVPDIPGHRCYDPCLWIDPLDRLWLIWADAPNQSVYACVCQDPDADKLVWSEKSKIGSSVMMNKPIVLTSGEWLFPLAVWDTGIWVAFSDDSGCEPGAYVYRSVDNGEHFEAYGKAGGTGTAYDEHMVIELKDNTLMMLIRAAAGIDVSYSYDSGRTWTERKDSGIKGPCSRFCIRRLKSGRIILVNHYNFTGRNNLTALLSEDEGKTWKYKLLLDERSDVSYPDLKEGEDGYIYIVYDRERGAFNRSLSKTLTDAREILYAKITEDDIIRGEIVTPGSCLKMMVNKLKEYRGDDPNPYNE